VKNLKSHTDQLVFSSFLEILLAKEFVLSLSRSSQFRRLFSLIAIHCLSMLVLNALHQLTRLGCVEELLFPDISANVAAVIFVVVIGGVGAYIDLAVGGVWKINQADCHLPQATRHPAIACPATQGNFRSPPWLYLDSLPNAGCFTIFGELHFCLLHLFFDKIVYTRNNCLLVLFSF
jgi:hypothetical protein